ncbi:MAG: hypothetical protein BRD57_04860, partial [Proteobacteria bacterium SW_6_67_9]
MEPTMSASTDRASDGLESLLADSAIAPTDLVERLPELFFLLDREGRLRYWNRQLAVVTGYRDDELASMHAPDFFPAADRARIEEALAQSFDDGEVRIEADLVGKDRAAQPHLF